jgi:hypothetical protein
MHVRPRLNKIAQEAGSWKLEEDPTNFDEELDCALRQNANDGFRIFCSASFIRFIVSEVCV